MEILKEILGVFNEVADGLISLITKLKPGVESILEHPFIAGISKAIAIILGIIAGIYILVSWIKGKK